MSNIDYTFSNIDWASLPAEALAAFAAPTAAAPAPTQAMMTPAEIEAAAALAAGQPTGRPPVEATVPAGTPAEAVTTPGTTAQTPAEPPAPVTTAPPAPAGPSESAVQVLRDILTEYGLGDLADTAYNFLAANPTGTNEDFLRSLRSTTVYQERFAGNAARVAAGLPELTPGEYVALENGYREAFQFYNIPTEFYDETSDFKKLIEGNVDVVDLRDRIDKGYVAVRDSSPDVIKQMEALYGVTEPQLAAYFLDPERGKNILARQAEAAKVGAAALQGGGIQIGATMAERLASENLQPATVREGFSAIAAQRGLFQGLARGEEEISQEEQITSTFGLDQAARQRIETRRRRRLAEFEEGGGFAETAQGVVGLRTVGQ